MEVAVKASQELFFRAHRFRFGWRIVWSPSLTGLIQGDRTTKGGTANQFVGFGENAVPILRTRHAFQQLYIANNQETRFDQRRLGSRMISRASRSPITSRISSRSL